MRKFYALLFSHFVPVKDRFLEYSRRIVPCILHCCGCWSWGSETWHTIHSWEAKTLARMLNIGHKTGENTLKWWCNRIIVARRKFRQMGFESLATCVLRRIFKFSLNTVWKGPHAMDHVVQQCASWRNVLWWHQEKTCSLEIGGTRVVAGRRDGGRTSSMSSEASNGPKLWREMCALGKVWKLLCLLCTVPSPVPVHPPGNDPGQ